MEVNINAYRIIVISCSDVEDNLANRLNNLEDYFMVCVSESVASVQTDQNKHIAEDVIFILINPEKNLNNDFITSLADLCSKKKVIFYLHNSDMEKDCLKSVVKVVKEKNKGNIQEINFSHEPDDNKYKPYKEFLIKIKKSLNGTTTFKEHIETLIKKSLKKKSKHHLIALSILCQGYLAAHGGKDLNGWDDSMIGLLVSDAKEKTEDKSWWQPAFEKKDGVKIKQSDGFLQTIIHDELTSMGKECENSSAIEALFDEIKRLNRESFCNPDKVIATYNCIKELL